MKLMASLHENVLFHVEKITKNAKMNICHQERNFFLKDLKTIVKMKKPKKKRF